MTEPMTRVLHELCTEIDNLKQQLDWAGQREATEQARTSSVRVELQTAKDRLAEVRSSWKSANDEADKQRQAALVAVGELERYDTLRHDLYHYIVELAGHRDTAKTKAERVALGHVVERLAEICGMNDEERRAVA